MRTSPNRLVGLIVGAVYVLVGFLGFAVTPGIGFFATAGGRLFDLLEVNPAQNILHVLIGAALMIAALSAVGAAKAVNSGTGTFFLVLGLAGLFLVGGEANVLALNVADNALHFGTASLLLAVGLGGDKRASAAAS